MKKMKKFFAVILSLAMVLGMSITSFGAETGKTTTITLKGAAGATVYSQQIVEADQINSVTGWKFSTNDAAKAFADKFKTEMSIDANNDDAAIQALITLGALETAPNAKAEAGQINTGNADTKAIANAYSKALKAATDKIDLTTVSNAYKNISDSFVVNATATAGLHAIKADKAGYTYNSMMAYVAFDKDKTDGTVLAATVQAKGAEDQVKKEIDTIKVDGQVIADQNTSVTKDDIIKYTITQAYPFYPADAQNPEFTIVDKVTNADFNQDTIVTSGDDTLENGKDYNIAYTKDDANNAIMTITFNYSAARAGQTVKVKYGVTVRDLSTIDGAKVVNEATATANGKYTVAQVESASVTFTVKKVDADDTADTKAGLSGAEFQLYVACTKDTTGAEELTLKDGKTKVWAKSLGESQKKTTDKNGNAKFVGLDADKTYYVLETKAPAGYSINKNAIQLTGASVTMGATSSETVEVKGDDGKVLYTYTKETTPVERVTNFNNEEYTDTKLSSLPSTGGIGTTIFTIAGCAIMIAAAGFFFASRKKTNR